MHLTLAFPQVTLFCYCSVHTCNSPTYKTLVFCSFTLEELQSMMYQKVAEFS